MYRETAGQPPNLEVEFGLRTRYNDYISSGVGLRENYRRKEIPPCYSQIRREARVWLSMP